MLSFECLGDLAACTSRPLRSIRTQLSAIFPSLSLTRVVRMCSNKETGAPMVNPFGKHRKCTFA